MNPSPFPKAGRAAGILRPGTLILALLLVLTGGCSTVGSTLGIATRAELNFQVASNVNPDDQGHASPIVLDVLVLRNKRQFEQEDFLSLYQNARQQLGKDLIRKIRLKEFIPGEHRTEKLKLADDAHYLGVMAEYSRYDKAQTKVVLKVEPHTTSDFRIKVGRLGLRVEE